MSDSKDRGLEIRTSIIDGTRYLTVKGAPTPLADWQTQKRCHWSLGGADGPFCRTAAVVTLVTSRNDEIYRSCVEHITRFGPKKVVWDAGADRMFAVDIPLPAHRNPCPVCGQDLGYHTRQDRLCPGTRGAFMDDLHKEPIQIPLACECNDFASSHSQGTGRCYGWCDQTCTSFRPVEIDRTNSAFEAIRRAANAKLWPQGFASDLYRDWQALVVDEDAPTVFVWGLRANGTEYFHPHVQSLRWMEASQRSNESVEWYVWDGTDLRRVEYKEARSFLGQACRGG